MPPLDLSLFAVGFFVSAVTSLAILALIVGRQAEDIDDNVRATLLMVTTAALVVADWRRVCSKDHCAIGLRRQTPRHWGFSPLGVVAWGLDTGLVFSTARATALPILGLALVLLGVGSEWAGLAYAGGFLATLIGICLIRDRSQPTTTRLEDAIFDRLIRLQPQVHFVGLVLTLAGGIFTSVFLFVA